MKKKTLLIILCAALALILLAACSAKEEASRPVPTSPSVEASPLPAESPEPGNITIPTTTPVPTETPASAVATPASSTAAPALHSAPVITKDPSGEALNAGGSCTFVAKADNATSIVWRFVSPDGRTDEEYSSVYGYFPNLTMSGGTEETLRMSNVPYDLNGWRVYCRFSNEAGSVDTSSATITVTAVTPTPAPTDSPASEYVPVYAASDYAGTYYAGRATMDIMGGPTSYIVDITWGGSAFDYVEWTFSGTVDSQGVLYYNNCQKTTFTFDENGNETSVVEYNGGSGCIYSDYTSGMCWDDYEEGVADGLSFNR